MTPAEREQQARAAILKINDITPQQWDEHDQQDYEYLLQLLADIDYESHDERMQLIQKVFAHDATQRATIQQQEHERQQITAALHDDDIPTDEPLSLNVEAVRELRLKFQQQAERIMELRDIICYVSDCEPDGKKYLDEAKALGKDCEREQQIEREELRKELSLYYAMQDRLAELLAPLGLQAGPLEERVEQLVRQVGLLEQWKSVAQWAARMVLVYAPGNATENRERAQGILDGKVGT